MRLAADTPRGMTLLCNACGHVVEAEVETLKLIDPMVLADLQAHLAFAGIGDLSKDVWYQQLPGPNPKPP